MDDIANILGNKKFAEPPEISAIKKYVLDKFKSNVKIQVRENAIIVLVNSPSLANTLRLDSQQLIESCNVTKKLVIRIS